MRYFIKFSYDGSCFNGFQRQNKLKTVQGVMEEVLTLLNNGKKVNICASGRTDKGVHAKGQTAHFDLDVSVKLYNLKKYLNKCFNGEIYVKDVYVVNDSFHARYDVLSKTYCYYINMGEYDPCMRNYILQYNKGLNVELMNSVIPIFLGEHDFRSFCFDEKNQDNCVRTIYDVKINVNNCLIKIEFTGNGFLRKMVRNLVSVLILVGECKLNYSDVLCILECQKKSYNVKCVSSCGLYLDNIVYKGYVNE